jgi:hypothetical protein
VRNNRWRVYINPFNSSGTYTGYVDVTDDVDFSQMGTIDSSLDNTDYDIGIFRNSNFNVTFRNDSGKYSDVGQPGSMFQYTRSNSLFKITWCENDIPVVCGFFPAGNTVLAPEETVFTGLISDKDLEIDIQTRELTFTILGLETVLSLTTISQPLLQGLGTQLNFTTNYASAPNKLYLSVSGTNLDSYPGVPWNQPVQFITSGGTSSLPSPLTTNSTYYICQSDELTGPYFIEVATNTGNVTGVIPTASLDSSIVKLTSDAVGTVSVIAMFAPIKNVLYAILNQAQITNYLTVNMANINPFQGAPQTYYNQIYDMSLLQGMTVWDALTSILLVTDSVFYISNNTIYIAPRTASTSVMYAFYGQASTLGAENIQEMSGIKNGIARTFNDILYGDANYSIQDTASITKYGDLQFTVSDKLYGVGILSNGPINPGGPAYGGSTRASAISEMLNVLANDFSTPKQEMDLYTPINSTTLFLGFLARVTIDYPAVTLPDGTVSQCFVETPSNPYKIEGISIDPSTDLICFSIRRI